MPRVQGNSGERGEIVQWSNALQNALRTCPSRAYLASATDHVTGYELLARFPARLDLQHNVLELAPAANAFGRAVAPVRFDYFDRQPEVPGSLGDLTGEFSIDTGSNLNAEVQALTLADHSVHSFSLRKYL